MANTARSIVVSHTIFYQSLSMMIGESYSQSLDHAKLYFKFSTSFQSSCRSDIRLCMDKNHRLVLKLQSETLRLLLRSFQPTAVVPRLPPLKPRSSKME